MGAHARSGPSHVVAAHPPARAAFAELRDRAAPPESGLIEFETFRDWTCLNEVLGESARSLAWFDALDASDRGRLGLLLELAVIPLLVSAQRWADAGALYLDPLATLERNACLLMSRNLAPELVEHVRSCFEETWCSSFARYAQQTVAPKPTSSRTARLVRRIGDPARQAPLNGVFRGRSITGRLIHTHTPGTILDGESMCGGSAL